MRWSRARFVVALSLLAAGIGLGPGCGRRSLVLPDANVLLIVIDTLRADRLGAYGYTRDTSPTLDRMAREGVLFERVITQGAWTPPAMGSLFTSLYPHVHGAVEFKTELSERLLTLPDALQARGYYTMGVQMNPSLGRGFDQGFDSYVKLFKRRDSRTVQHFADRLKELRGRKFFAYLHLMGVHLPYEPREPFLSRFVAPYTGSLLRPQRIGAGDRWTLRQRSLTDADKRHVVGHYDAGVAQTDSNVARILAALEQERVADSTIVIVTSDHGEELFDRRSFGHGHSLQREIVRVPLIVRHPAVRRGGVRVRQLVRHIDIFPTILGFLGMEIPPALMGRDLRKAIENPDVDWQLIGFSESMLEGPPQFAVEQGRYKLLRFEPPTTRGERRTLLEVHRLNAMQGLVELYDLEKDPDERQAIDMGREQDRLVRLMDGERRAGEHLRIEAATEDIEKERLEQLRSLGYVR